MILEADEPIAYIDDEPLASENLDDSGWRPLVVFKRYGHNFHCEGHGQAS